MSTGFVAKPGNGAMLRSSISITVLVAALACAAGVAAAPLTLNDVNEAPLTTSAGDGFLDRLIQDAFRRAGAECKLVRHPAERGLRNANAGIDDGDLNRISGLESAYANLVRVPEKNMDMHFSAFTRTLKLQSASWSALASHRVGIIRGWKILESSLEGAGSVLFASDVHQLFRMLKHDRATVVLYSRLMGLAHIREFDHQGVRVLEPPLAKREMFMYLHQKHAALVPKIAAALREMKADGTYQRFYDETIEKLERR